MNVKELKQLLEKFESRRDYGDNAQVCIKVERIGAVGAMPTVEIKSVSMGIDWDKGKVIIYPETLLREVDRDELSAIRKKVEEAGWDYYELTNLKKENVRLKKKLKELEKLQSSNPTEKDD
jgi:hypothetical protein